MKSLLLPFSEKFHFPLQRRKGHEGLRKSAFSLLLVIVAAFARVPRLVPLMISVFSKCCLKSPVDCSMFPQS